MNELSNHNFGLLIAYLLPGFVAMWGVAFVSPAVRALLVVPNSGPTVGGFLYLTLACAAMGVTISTIRWAVIDPLHSLGGVRKPRLDFRQLQDNVAAFNMLVEIHYRYYQFHANMFVAVAISYVFYRTNQSALLGQLGWLDLAFGLLELVLFAGSRDTLKKYYSRSEQLLSRRKSV